MVTESGNYVTPTPGGEHIRQNPCQPLHYEASLSACNPFFRPPLPPQGSIHHSPLHRPAQLPSSSDEDTEPFPLNMTNSWQDIESYWNDPLLKVDSSPSQEFTPLPDPPKTFQARLDFAKENLQDAIAMAPPGEQAGLVEELVAWARQLAENPRPPHDDEIPCMEDFKTEAV